MIWLPAQVMPITSRNFLEAAPRPMPGSSSLASALKSAPTRVLPRHTTALAMPLQDSAADSIRFHAQIMRRLAQLCSLAGVQGWSPASGDLVNMGPNIPEHGCIVDCIEQAICQHARYSVLSQSRFPVSWPARQQSTGLTWFLAKACKEDSSNQCPTCHCIRQQVCRTRVWQDGRLFRS